MTDPDLVARIDPEGVAFWRTLGIEVAEVEAPGHVVLRLRMRPEYGTRRPEIMHGGAIASLVDAAAGGAIASLHGGDEDYAGQVTLDLNVTFLNAAAGDVFAEGRVLRSGRSLAFTQVDVRTADGTPVATGRATYSVLRRR